MKPKKQKPETPSAGMLPAIRRLLAAEKSDAAIIAALKPRYPVTPGVLHYARTGERRLPKKAKAAAAKVRVVQKLPAPAAARQRRVA